jgi:hypothetical protein
MGSLDGEPLQRDGWTLDVCRDYFRQSIEAIGQVGIAQLSGSVSLRRQMHELCNLVPVIPRLPGRERERVVLLEFIK